MKYGALFYRLLLGLPALLWSALSSTPSQAQTGPTLLRIELRPTVEVIASSLVLGDVAFISSSDLVLMRKAMALPLGRPPGPGGTTVIDAVRLAPWVRVRLGLRHDQIEWAGATSSLLSTASQTIPGYQITAAARASLEHHLMLMTQRQGFRDVRIDLQPSASLEDVAVPPGATQIVVRALHPYRPSKRTLVWVDLVARGVTVKAVPVRFDVSVFAKAPTTSAALAASSRVSSEAVQWQELELLDIQHPQPAQQAMEPQQVRLTVASGTQLTNQHIKAAPAISRGDQARLVSQNGLVTLESKVESLQDGRLGEWIRVRPVNATEALLARVVGPGQLELQP